MSDIRCSSNCRNDGGCFWCYQARALDKIGIRLGRKMPNWKPVGTPSLLRWQWPYTSRIAERMKKNPGKSIVTFTIEGDDGIYFHEW